jgi:nitrite reductase/ring-hydroxylating ferredoxin subunit
VTTAGVGALAASGLGLAAGLAIPRKPGAPPIRYFGAHRVAGPAPRGIPYIPIGLQDGVFIGKPSVPHFEAGEADINVLDWYKYCGHSGAPGLQPGFTDDNTITYLPKEEYEHLITPWFKPYLDQPVRLEHFPADNFGAAFKWRSENQGGANVVTGVIIRVARSQVKRVESTVPPAKPISEDEFNWLLENVFHVEGNSVYIGVSSYCTHFCCAPGYREAEKLARPRAAWDNIFCTCHNSNYNFREPVAFTFAPEVATEAGGFDPLLQRGGGGGSGGH